MSERLNQASAKSAQHEQVSEAQNPARALPAVWPSIETAWLRAGLRVLPTQRPDLRPDPQSPTGHAIYPATVRNLGPALPPPDIARRATYPRHPQQRVCHLLLAELNVPADPPPTIRHTPAYKAVSHDPATARTDRGTQWDTRQSGLQITRWRIRHFDRPQAGLASLAELDTTLPRYTPSAAYLHEHAATWSWRRSASWKPQSRRRTSPHGPGGDAPPTPFEGD
jgi:hypothetical protein